LDARDALYMPDDPDAERLLSAADVLGW